MSSLNWGELISEAADASGGSYDPLPDGEYEFKVIEASAVTTQTGKPMFKLTAEVQTGAHAKRRVWDNLVISAENKTALSIFFGKMKALGLTEDYFRQNPPGDQVASAMLNRTFRGQVGSRVWNGDTRNELKRYAPVASAGIPASAPVAAAAAPAPAPAPAPSAAAPAPAPAPAAPAVAPAPSAEAAPPPSPF